VECCQQLCTGQASSGHIPQVRLTTNSTGMIVHILITPPCGIANSHSLSMVWVGRGSVHAHPQSKSLVGVGAAACGESAKLVTERSQVRILPTLPGVDRWSELFAQS
jgi:hypothetical protein